MDTAFKFGQEVWAKNGFAGEWEPSSVIGIDGNFITVSMCESGLVEKFTVAKLAKMQEEHKNLEEKETKMKADVNVEGFYHVFYDKRKETTDAMYWFQLHRIVSEIVIREGDTFEEDLLEIHKLVDFKMNIQKSVKVDLTRD